MDIHLDRNSFIPLGEQLKVQIQLLIQENQLQPKSQLPTVKELAGSLKLNYNTVATVYRSLEREGYLMQNRRAGTKVADEPPRNPEQALAVTLSQDIQKQLQALNLSNNDFLKILTAQQNRTQPMNFNVAVLAKTPLDAMQISEKSKMIWGEQVICVPETIQTYKSTSYHLTVIDPALVPSLHASANVIMEDGFTYSHDFPAGAD